MGSVRTSVAGGGTTGTSDRTLAITPAVGDLLFAIAFVSTNTNNVPTCSDNNGSGTYDRIDVGNVVIATVDHRLSIFVRTALMVNTTSTTVTVATGSNTSGCIVIGALTGMTKVGAAAIRSKGLQNNQAAATPAPVMNQAPLTANICVAGVGSADTTTTPPGGGWSELQDTTQANPTIALEVASINSGHTSATVTFGAAQSTTFCSFAIEFDTSAGGLISTIARGMANGMSRGMR